MDTRLTELLGIKYPIIQGGMAWVAQYQLAASVSEAGGLGIIGAGAASANWVEEQIRELRKLTNKPFGVNIMLKNPEADKIAEVVAREKVPVVTTGAGSPERYVAMWKEAGIIIIPVIPSVNLAKRMEKCGADAVVAEGCEAGGHIGSLTTMALVPQVVDGVGIPVIAAGGIGDGRGVAAAMILGASGVQMGTSFITVKESIVHENYKEAIFKAKDIDTKVTGRSVGLPVRSIRNQLTTKYLAMEADGATWEELEHLALGGLRSAVVDGDLTMGSLMAGQIAGLIKEELSCKDYIEQTMKETFKLLQADY